MIRQAMRLQFGQILLISAHQIGHTRGNDKHHDGQNSDCDRYDEAFNIDAVNQHAAACGAKYRG